MKLKQSLILSGVTGFLALPAVGTTAGAAEPVMNLPQFVVTATMSEQPMRLAPASVSMVGLQELQQTASASLLEVMRETTGLSLVGQGVGGRKVLLLRGMEARHSLILVDGRRISATDAIVGHSDFQYDWVPLSAIERIEVVRGPMSALYGSEAMGGVVNIITRPVPEDWGGELSVSAGLREDGRGGDEFASSVHLAGPLNETLGLRLTAMYRYLNDTPLEADERITELEGLEIYGANAQLNWSPSPNNRFEFQYSRVQEDRWRDTDTRGSAPYYLSGYDLVRQLAGVRWLPRFGEWYGQAGMYEARTDAVGYRDDGGSPVTPQFMRDRVGDFNITGPLGEEMDLTIGGEVRAERLRHRAFVAGQDTAKYLALFAQHQWRFIPDWSLTTALRWDDHNSFGSELSPRAYLVWSIHPNWVLKGGYGRGFRAPTLKQSSAEYRFEGAHTFVGNPDVGPETSESFELSALYEVNGSLSFSVSAFRNNITDLIAIELLEIIPGPRPQRVSTYVNVSRARIDGVEADVTWRPIGGLRLRAGYAWLEGMDLDANQPLTKRPEHRLTANAQYSWLQDRLSAGIALEYNGRQYVRSGTPSVLAQLPGYTMVNVNTRWQINDRHSLVAMVNNITNVDLIHKSADFGYAERGRSYALRWSVAF